MLGGELVSRCRLTFSTITAKPIQASYYEFGSWQNPKQCSCWWASRSPRRERERKMFYLTTHSTHFIYGYMASDIWLRTILIVRKETRCRHIGYSYRLAARVLLYAPSHRQDNTYHGLCYTSRGALAGTRNSSKGPPHEGSIRRPIAPWANALPLSYVPLPGHTVYIFSLTYRLYIYMYIYIYIYIYVYMCMCVCGHLKNNIYGTLCRHF